jgi:lipopolysaccharide export LptBFGC system permease protein LptF
MTSPNFPLAAKTFTGGKRITPVDASEGGDPLATMLNEAASLFSAAVLMTADVTTLSVFELRQLIEQQQTRGVAPARPLALLHARLAEPFVVLLFVLAAIPLGARVERSGAQGMTLPALQGIVIIAAFFSLRSATNTLTASGLLPPTTFPWLLLAAFASFGVWRFAEMPS